MIKKAQLPCQHPNWWPPFLKNSEVQQVWSCSENLTAGLLWNLLDAKCFKKSGPFLNVPVGTSTLQEDAPQDRVKVSVFPNSGPFVLSSTSGLSAPQIQALEISKGSLCAGCQHFPSAFVTGDTGDIQEGTDSQLIFMISPAGFC